VGIVPTLNAAEGVYIELGRLVGYQEKADTLRGEAPD